MIAFYYGLTGFACVWFYRKTMWAKPRDVLMQGVLPLLGGLLLVAFFVNACYTYADPDYGYTSIGEHRRRVPDRRRLAACSASC